MASEAPARSYGKVFDEVAAEYDRARPAYPDPLIDHACRVAAIGSGDRVLEIGCGSGQLTRSLVARGLKVTALEPGERLISLAERNVKGPEFVNARFEDAQLSHGHFKAVFSASAFHWLDPEVSWQKAARVLAPGGTLALVQYCGLREPHTLADAEAILSVLARIAPEVAAAWPPARELGEIAAGVEQRRDNVSEVWAWIGGQDVAWSDAGPLFGDAQIANAPIEIEQTAEELNALLRTLSMYHRISADQRQALERETVAGQERLGRPFRSSAVAVAVTARRH